MRKNRATDEILTKTIKERDAYRKANELMHSMGDDNIKLTSLNKELKLKEA